MREEILFAVFICQNQNSSKWNDIDNRTSEDPSEVDESEPVKQVILHYFIACVSKTGFLENSLDSLPITQQLVGHHSCIVRLCNFGIIFTCDFIFFFLLATLEGGSLQVIDIFVF